MGLASPGGDGTRLGPAFIRQALRGAFSRHSGTPRLVGVVIRERDESVYTALESAAFAYGPAAARAWVRPQFGHPAFRHWVATVDGVPAAIGTTIRTNGDAGPASYLTGLASLVEAAREALRALVDVASADAYSGGAAFVHTNPDSDRDDDILASHDPLEVPGFLIRVARA